MTNEAENKPETKEETKAVAPTRSRAVSFGDLFNEMDRLWDGFAFPWRARGLTREGLLPAIDVFEKEGKLHVNAELPGIKEKDIEIEVSDETLTISGEKHDEREVKEDNYYRSERTYGSFRRQVPLPAGADTDHIEAKFKDGVLKVEVPIAAKETPKKKIEIKAE